jgi:Ca2+-binding RTX toxin-like protein
MSNNIKVTGNNIAAEEIDKSNVTITLVKGASIAAVLADDAPYGFFETPGVDISNTHVIVNGRIYASANNGAKLLPMGINLSSIGASVSVGATGSIFSTNGIFVEGNGSIVSNAGTITAIGNGIFAQAANTHIANSGHIAGAFAVATIGDGVRVENASSGVITGYNTAISAQDAAHASYVNHGVIEALGAGAQAFAASQATLNIVNDGRIVGDINLGDGNDRIDTRGGRISGTINSGAGNDILLTDINHCKLTEGVDGGTDTVKSTVSYRLSANVENLDLLGSRRSNGAGNDLANIINGNAGNNVLSGGAGADHLDGGAGNDTMTGGSASDTFIFRSKGGHDVITDFEIIDEHIDVSGWKAVKSFTDLQSHMKAEDGGIMITYGNDSLFLDHIHRSDLQSTHFVF